MGTGTNQHGLKTIIADDDQRNALVDFVDEGLGPPDLHREGEQKWIPLFVETSPAIAIYAVVEPIAGAVRIGVGLEHTAGTGVPNVKTTIHVPVFHMKRRGQTDPQAGVPDLPDWLQLGRPGGRIAIGLECTFTSSAPVSGEAYLRGADVQLLVPTCTNDTVGFQLSLLDLQLPGATTPQTRTLDVESLSALGGDVLEFVVGMLRQQVDALNPADPVVRTSSGSPGCWAQRNGRPADPLADLPTQGVHALVAWLEQVIGDVATRTAWLTALGKLVGGDARPGDDVGRVRDRAGHPPARRAGHPGRRPGHWVVPWLDVTVCPPRGRPTRRRASTSCAWTRHRLGGGGARAARRGALRQPGAQRHRTAYRHPRRRRRPDRNRARRGAPAGVHPHPAQRRACPAGSPTTSSTCPPRGPPSRPSTAR